MRRVLISLLIAVVSPASVILAGAGPAPAGVPVVVLEGRGFGHGVGMAQDGALAMGRAGASSTSILSQFYPGTRLGRAGGEVRVAVLSAGGETTVTFPGGGEVRDARGGSESPGFPVRVPAGGQARIRSSGGRYSVVVPGASPAVRPAAASTVAPAPAAAPPPTPDPTTSTTRAPLLKLPDAGKLLPPPTAPVLLPPPTTRPAPPPPSTTAAAAPSSPRPLWAVPAAGGTVDIPSRKQRYRGVIEATGGEGGLRLVNHVDVEQYLRGMGEVRDPSWPQAGLRAQAIAARTYALRAVGGGGELCDSQRCQVYLGAGAEYAAMDRAVTATRGQVLLFGRSLASTVYSANGGGFSATPEEGFGTSAEAYPYLRAAPYPTGDPLTWTIRLSLRDVGRRLGYRGTVEGIRATSVGTSGRVLQVTLEGNRGVKSVSGLDFDRALGLRSTFFTLRLEESDTAPAAPPPAEGPVQLLPEEAAGGAGAPAEATEAEGPVEPDATQVPAPAPMAPPAAELAAAGARGDGTAAGGRIALSALAWLFLLGASLGLWFSRTRRPG